MPRTRAQAVEFKNRHEKMITVPIINNQISAKAIVDKIPKSILVDPTVKFITIESGKQWIIDNGH